MDPLFLALLLGLVFLCGWATNTVWRELTPYVIFWYNATVRKPLTYGGPPKEVVVKSIKDYEALTLRKRFVMERDKRLN